MLPMSPGMARRMATTPAAVTASTRPRRRQVQSSPMTTMPMVAEMTPVRLSAMGSTAAIRAT